MRYGVEALSGELSGCVNAGRRWGMIGFGGGAGALIPARAAGVLAAGRTVPLAFQRGVFQRASVDFHEPLCTGRWVQPAAASLRIAGAFCCWRICGTALSAMTAVRLVWSSCEADSWSGP